MVWTVGCHTFIPVLNTATMMRQIRTGAVTALVFCPFRTWFVFLIHTLQSKILIVAIIHGVTTTNKHDRPRKMHTLQAQ